MNSQPVINIADNNPESPRTWLVRLSGVSLPNSGFVTRDTWPASVMWAASAALFIGYIALRLAVRAAILAPNTTISLQPVEAMELSIFHLVGDIFLHIGYLAFSTLGVLIVLRHPENRIGSIFCVIGLLQAISEFATYYAIYALVVAPGSLPSALAAGWLQNWIIALTSGLVFIFLPLLFPSGRLLSNHWRMIGWLGIGTTILLAFWMAFHPGPLVTTALAALSDPLHAWKNPLAITALPNLDLMIVFWSGGGLFLACMLAAATSLILRFRRSTGDERQQIKWFAYIIALLAGIYIIDFPTKLLYFSAPSTAYFLVIVTVRLAYVGIAFIGLPIASGLAILKYRLYQIDIIINRTLVYGALTAIVISIYVLIVGVLGTTIQGHSNLLISILATGLVAVLVQPLRDRLQRGVNRMMYGERDDPVTVLSRLGQRLEATLAPDAVLPSLVETVAQTLKLPYVAIETRTDFSPVITYGQPGPEVSRFPLIYQSETIGQLLVSPRAPGEALSPMDRHLLENIAHQAGLAVHAVNLTTDLQRSRQRIITAREEERRRLRRDLHDGLGPNLASQGLKLAAAKQLLESKPESAEPLLDQVIAQNQATVEEIRRLVYGLRPPALDELGLVAAIRDHVAGMDGKASLQITVKEPAGGLPPLSAAVEVAAYRIVLEALTNVIRHAQANRCVIRFSLDENNSRHALQIKIQDDGVGLPGPHRAGVGTRSMRERAEEVGGTCAIESQQGGGTRVCVVMPLAVV